MSNNPSVRQFRTDMLDLVNKAKYNFHQEILAMADELVGNIQSAIEHSVSGNLKKSVRKKDVSTADETKLSVLVLAGGPLTTKREASGSFDYALAEEFGTRREGPRPFFYNTVRFYKAQAEEKYRETLEQTIEENNKVRGLRANNYNNVGVNSVRFGITMQTRTTISSGYRGAVVIQKRS
jgi:HK97 gp10 family phage protein